MAKTKQDQPQAAKGGGGKKKGGGGAVADKPNAELPKEPPRLRQFFRETVVPKMAEDLGVANRHAQPRPAKVSINMGIGQAFSNKPRLERLVQHLTQLSGQRAIITKARRSIAGFKLREGMPVGCKVTLRKDRMWYFLDKLIALAMPRIRDFRGISSTSFDKAGNYTVGLTEQTLFPEIDADNLDHADTQGMDITIVFENSDPDKSRWVLRELGMPFRKEEEGGRRGA